MRSISSGTGGAVISVDDMEEGLLRTRVQLQGRRRDEAKKPPGIRGLSKKEDRRDLRIRIGSLVNGISVIVLIDDTHLAML